MSATTTDVTSEQTSTDGMSATTDITSEQTSTDVMSATTTDITSEQRSTDVMSATTTDITSEQKNTDVMSATTTDITSEQTSTDVTSATTTDITSEQKNTDVMSTMHDAERDTTQYIALPCQCPCSKTGKDVWGFLRGKNYSMEKIQKILQPHLDLLVRDIRVNLKNTSKFVHTKISALDTRISTESMGYVASIVLCLAIAIVIVFDLLKYFA